MAQVQVAGFDQFPRLVEGVGVALGEGVGVGVPLPGVGVGEGLGDGVAVGVEVGVGVGPLPFPEPPSVPRRGSEFSTAGFVEFRFAFSSPVGFSKTEQPAKSVAAKSIHSIFFDTKFFMNIKGCNFGAYSGFYLNN